MANESPKRPVKNGANRIPTTRKKSAGVGSFWWKHLGGLFYDFLVICGCAIFIAGFVGSGRFGSVRFSFQWKHGLTGANRVDVWLWFVEPGGIRSWENVIHWVASATSQIQC